MLADAPGEWFRRWAVNENSDDAEGARWVSDNADVLILIADCEALSHDESVGPARHDIQALAPRIAKHLRNRPVALVWAKADKIVAPETVASVRNAVLASLPNVVEFHVSVRPSSGGRQAPGVIKLLDWIVERSRPSVLLPERRIASDDPFLQLGRV